MAATIWSPGTPAVPQLSHAATGMNTSVRVHRVPLPRRHARSSHCMLRGGVCVCVCVHARSLMHAMAHVSKPRSTLA